MSSLEKRALQLLVVAVSLAFVWILAPFSGTILWALVFAILFAPVFRRLRFGGRQGRNLAALETVLIVIVMVIIPLNLIGGELLDQAIGVYRRIHSGELDFGRYFQQIYIALPQWAIHLLERFELTDLASIRDRVSAVMVRSSQFMAAQAFSVGQQTVSFALSLLIMLYLLFFLLRDGEELLERIQGALPLRAEQQRALIARFVVAIRATVKGNFVVAILQGILGALAFWLLGIRGWLLWGSLMAILSLLPLVGAILVWGPVALYYLATGNTGKGLFLVAFGMLVVSGVDYALRPMLVRRETRLPDYLVLLATFGGLAVLGINGFIVGPVIAAMFVAVWDLFASTRHAGDSSGVP